MLGMVEARGVEPLSENQFLRFSPGADNRLEFPSADAGCQASVLVSSEIMTESEESPRSRSLLIDAHTCAAVLTGRTAA